MLYPNKNLMLAKNITGAHKILLENAYAKLNVVLTKPELYRSDEEVVERVEALQYVIQFLYDFDMTKDYHTYWYKVKGCSCPKLDNNDPMVAPNIRITDTTCKFHGTKENRNA